MDKRGLILIVDDDIVSKRILSKLFDRQYEIMEASNGEEALKLVRQQEDRLILIILDVYMPIINGYAVMEALAQNSKWSSIPVVVATSEDRPESDQRLFDLGAYTVIHKPFHSQIMQKQINNLLERLQRHNTVHRDYELQNTLIHKTASAFTCTYHFDEEKAAVEENYKDFFEDHFAEVFTHHPFDIESIVLPKNLKEARYFFDIWNKDKMHDEIELRLRVDAVHYEWFKIAVMIQCGSDGRRETAVFLFTNIKYEMEAKDKLTFMARNDVLTRIPNMRTFADDVRQMIDAYPEEDFQMLTLDIYQFRLVNKLFGHTEGDKVLRFLATKIQEMVESYEKGVYCRMSSDIFYVCLSTKNPVEEFAQALQDDIEDYPINFALKLCIGVYPIHDRNENVEDMIEHASFSRRETKRAPFNAIQIYNEELQKEEYFETYVIAEMENALLSRQFEVYYQPKCEIGTKKVIGAEALIRWNSTEHGQLPPATFIPIFEQNGFITKLDYYVYEEVCRQLRSWIDTGIKPLPISVNVSRCDLYDRNIFERIYEIVERYQIPHDLIEFEITESAFVTQSSPLEAFTRKLREKGFCVLIDDFGSGYSSLNSLKEIDVDVLKIDIKFLPISMDDNRSSVILQAVIGMAHDLGLGTIAEGVETKEQYELLAKLDCNQAQGFYYHRPMPVAQYEKFLQ